METKFLTKNTLISGGSSGRKKSRNKNLNKSNGDALWQGKP